MLLPDDVVNLADMIPYKLRLQNFLSYREGQSPLDFSGMHLVCLVGENGHGKSALLDAVTWVVWGQARGKSDDDLVHLGAGEMQVEFEFGLAGQRYNIIRKRLISGKTRKSELELAVWNEHETGWQPLTEPTLRATQARIESLLRMDYHTFVHSAFLKQGAADAFSRALPGARKDILARILNLAQYDAYAERAKALAKEAEREAALVEGEVRVMDEEIARRPQVEADLNSATITELQARLALKEAEEGAAALRLQEQALAGRRRERDELAARLQRDARLHDDTGRQLASTGAQVAAVVAILAERQAIEAGYAALTEARSDEARWAERWQAQRPLEIEQQQLRHELVESKGKIESDLRLARRELDEANTRAASLPGLEPKAGQTAAEIARLEALAERVQARRDQAAHLGADRARFQQEKGRIEAEGKALSERLKMFRSGEASECPVCRQPLGEDGRQHIDQDYEQQLAALRRQLLDLGEAQKKNQTEEQALQTAIAAESRELGSLAALQRQLAQIEHSLNDARAALETLPALQDRAAALTRQIESQDFGLPTRARLAAVEGQMAAIAYDAAAHDRARATVSDLAGVERRHLELARAVQDEPALRQQAEGLAERHQAEATQLAADGSRLQQIEADLSGLADLQTRLRQLQATAEQSRRAWEGANNRLVGAQQRLSAIDGLAKTRSERLQQLALIKERAARFHHLQTAFGPNGVQAMIIEAALPELESEANRLLGRLSDGRMNVRFETQRELKTGGQRETLDIIIADELGQRPYEMFSGGEGFRADLALRIALSRLLARRAGAALQTLFIDEGFGTQDTHGRENLVEAIHMIKDEFALVLVITHIEELKEQFPVRIQVVKDDGQGSRYRVY